MPNLQLIRKDERRITLRSVPAGFTMVELIVAVAILSTSILAIFGALNSCLRASHHTRMSTNSVLLAESMLTETRLAEKITLGTTRGKQDMYQWQVKVSSCPVENLFTVSVKVEWLEQNRQQQYELLSLIHFQSNIEGK